MVGTPSDDVLEKRIVQILKEPNNYSDYPAPVIRKSRYGNDRAHCPEPNCEYEGLKTGFNMHFTRAHRPDNTRQKAKQIIQELRCNGRTKKNA